MIVYGIFMTLENSSKLLMIDIRLRNKFEKFTGGQKHFLHIDL